MRRYTIHAWRVLVWSFCACLLVAPQQLRGQSAVTSWQIHPEDPRYAPRTPGYLGLCTSDQGATQSETAFRPRGPNAWYVTGHAKGDICNIHLDPLPDVRIGSWLTVRVRMRVTEPSTVQNTVIPVTHVAVHDAGSPTIDASITTATLKVLGANSSESKSGADETQNTVPLGSDTRYGEVFAGRWEYNGGPIDIRVEYLGGTTMILDWISIGVEDASSTGSAEP